MTKSRLWHKPTEMPVESDNHLVVVKYWLWFSDEDEDGDEDYAFIYRSRGKWYYALANGQIEVDWSKVIAWRYLKTFEGDPE